MKWILAIDDDKNISALFKRYLTTIGYNVVTQNNGTAGIEAFNNGHDFDVVITDICMPGISGNEVAEYIRKSDKGDTPVIAITGSGDDLIQKELFNEILKKPVKLKDLANTITSYS